jgi:hypothetical protein
MTAATTSRAALPSTDSPEERARAGTSPLAVARTAGVLYLVIFALGLFSELLVRARLIESGDAATTAENILGSESLFRIGFAADLTVFLADAAVAVLLYVLLRPVSTTLALVAAAFRLVQTAILGLNLLNHYMALQILTGDAYAGLGRDEREVLAFSYLDAHTYGYLIGLVFFGLHLAVIGYLVFRSGYLPRFLGVLLALASVGYVVDSFSFFLVAGYDGALSPIVLAPAVVAELATILWLIRKGVDVPQWHRRNSSASLRIA